MDATNTVQSWGHPQRDSLGSYTSSEIGSKLSKHGIHLDRFFRDAHALCTCICVLWAFPKTIDALPALHMPVVFSLPYEHTHTPCGHSHYVMWAFPLCPVGIPIMPCGHSQSPYFILCSIHRLSSARPMSIPPWGPICPVGIPFPLCPVGIHITPCGHSHYSPWALPSRSPNPHFILCPICLWSSVCPRSRSIPPWTSICPVGIPIMPCGYSNHALWPFPTATHALGFSVTWFPTDLEKCLNLNTVLKTAWFSNLPWKLSFFLKTAWKWL